VRTLPNERLSEADRDAGPERKCILSGDIAPRSALVRLAVSPEGEVLPDILARAPGRGAWIGVSRAELEKALSNGKLKGALARTFGKGLAGTPLLVPEDLAARIEAGLLRAVVERLGLEMRAGNLLIGSDRIAEQARAGRVRWLAHASDAGEDGCRKLDQAWRVGRDAEGSGLCGLRLSLDRATLSVALGRDNVVHMALTDRASADRVAALLARLEHFQGPVQLADTDLRKRAADSAAPLASTALPGLAPARMN
jgi:predicted RNA-binding protein YlxR (DUF448 family)